MTTFHDRRTGQHLEIHGGGYFAKPKTAATLPTVARKSTEPVDARAASKLAPTAPDPRATRAVAAPVTAAARKPDPFRRAG